MLTLFALLAGAVTAVSPCVLPVLPAVLSATGSGGRRRPVGVVCGLALTFLVTIVGFATVADGVGLGDGLLRTVAVVVLAAFGVALVWPALARRVEAPLSGLSRFGPTSRGDGLLSGLLVGGALGFVYAPCAGPILAAVISVGATRGATLDTVAIGAAYALGSAVTLLVVALGGRRLVRRAPQRAFGVVMVLTAIVMATQLDVRFQEALADDLPAAVSNPTRPLERSDAVQRRLADLRGAPRFAARRRADLAVLGTAPEFAGTGRWFNSRPLTLAGLRGRVVLIDFWTYTCINCIRTFPALRALHARYARSGLTIVGVHTPEFGFERDPGNVARAIAANRLRYPVVQDNDYATWEAWGNQYWPAKYLIDAQGRVRYAHFGEGGYDKTEAAVRALLREAGRARLAAAAPVRGIETADAGTTTPETYLGSARAERFLPRAPIDGTRTYRAPALPPDHFALRGVWRVDEESATAVENAAIEARVHARDVNLVLASRGGPRRVRVLLDGRPLRPRDAGADARPGGVVTVREQRLYRLVRRDRARSGRVTLLFDGGVQGFAFTFG